MGGWVDVTIRAVPRLVTVLLTERVNPMEKITMIKAAWNGKKATLTADQKKILDYFFEIAAELGIYGERDNFRLVLELLSEHFSECHMPFTAVYEAAKEFCVL